MDVRRFSSLVRLNYYRLEAGRFEDFVSYGLKSFAHDGETENIVCLRPTQCRLDGKPTLRSSHATAFPVSVSSRKQS